MTANVTIADATELYFTAQFAECIDACHRLAVLCKSAESRSELTLLTARSLLRLGRYVEAEDVLSTSSPHSSPDARLTSKMLTAQARISRGAPDEGLALLDAAKAEASGAHRSIQAESELYTAYAYFAKRDIYAALHHIARVDIDSDIIHARSLQLQGFCYSWTGRKRDAAASYSAALSRLDRCTHRDYVVAAAAFAGLSLMALEIMNPELMQLVITRYSAMHWPTITANYRHQVEICLASYWEFNGDLPKAKAFASLAMETAGTNAGLQVGTFGFLARFAGHSRDHVAARQYLDSAWSIISSLDDSDVHGSAEANWAILELIREIAPYDAARARLLFERCKRIKKNSLNIHSGSFQATAYLRFLEGLIFHSEGNAPQSRQCFADAHDAFRICDDTPAAVESAHWLAILGDKNMHWYVSGSLAGIRNWMTELHSVKIS